MFHRFEDLPCVRARLPFVLVRTYNNQSAVAGPFGFGWTHSYNSSLLDLKSTGVVYTDENGAAFEFALQSGNYVSPPGLNLTLTKDAGGI